MYKPKPPKLVTIAIVTTITIVFWGFFGLYQVLTTKPELQIPEVILEDINPTLDPTALNQLQDRLFFEEGQVDRIGQSFEEEQFPEVIDINAEQISQTPVVVNGEFDDEEETPPVEETPVEEAPVNENQ